MNTEMEDNFSSIVESCYSCNMSCDPWNVRQYEVLYEGTKIHDQDKIILCCVCSKVLKYAQKVINNIQGKSVMRPDFQRQKPIINLSTFNLGSVELSETINCDIVSSYSVLSVKNGVLTEYSDINVKIEDCSYELEILNDATSNDADLDDTNIEQEYSVFNISDKDTFIIPLKDLINNDKETQNKEQENKNESTKQTELNVIKEDRLLIKTVDDINMKAEEEEQDMNNGSTKQTIPDDDKEDWLSFMMSDDDDDEINEEAQDSNDKKENSKKDNQIKVPIVNLTEEEYLQEKMSRRNSEKYQKSRFKCTDCDKIILCCVCSKVLKYAQKVINNIQGKSVMRPDFQRQKPIINLSTFNLGSVELSETINCDIVSSYSVLSVKNGVLTEYSDINVKIEDCSYELEILNDATSNDADLDDTNIEQEYSVFNISDKDTFIIPLKDLINNDKETQNKEQENKNESTKQTELNVIKEDRLLIKTVDDINMKAEEEEQDMNNGSTKQTIPDDDKEDWLSFMMSDDDDDEINEEAQDSNDKKENSKKDNQIKVPIVNLTEEEYLQEKMSRRNSEKYQKSRFKCTDCVLGFFFENEYLRHMEKHSESAGPYECEYCKQRMTEDRSMDHVNLHVTRYKCILCNILRKESRTIREHLYSVHEIGNPPKVECDQCDKVYTSNASLQTHKRLKHRQQSNMKVTCDYCNKMLKVTSLRRHMITQHPVEMGLEKPKRNHICQECGAAFKSAAALKSHGTKHLDRRDFYCVECDKGFKSEAHLKTHLKYTAAHRMNSDLPKACTQCDKRFKTNREVERHMNAKHLNIKPHQCDICSKTFSCVNIMKKHKQFVHEGMKKLRKYKCELCDNSFAAMVTLNNHKRTHTGERPFQCDICQATFAQKSTMTTHIKLVHLGHKRNRKKKK